MNKFLTLFLSAFLLVSLSSSADAARGKSKKLWTKRNYPTESMAARNTAANTANRGPQAARIKRLFGKRISGSHFENPVLVGQSATGSVQYWATPSRRKNVAGRPVMTVVSKTKTNTNGRHEGRLRMPKDSVTIETDDDFFENSTGARRGSGRAAPGRRRARRQRNGREYNGRENNGRE